MAKRQLTIKHGRVEVAVPEELTDAHVLGKIFDRETWNRLLAQDEKKLRV
jgi:hypothetical protein